MVAVKVIVEPSVAVALLADMETFGVYCGTRVVEVAATFATALYVPSVAKWKVAP